MSKFLEVGQSWGQLMIQELRSNYERKGLKASGKFGESLEQSVTETESNLNIQILGAAQIGMMTFGRGANSKQNPEQLRKFVGWAGSTIFTEWVKNKGLDISPFAVAWKIAREGVKVPNRFNDGKLLEETFTAENLEKLNQQVGVIAIENLKSKYIKSWQ